MELPYRPSNNPVTNKEDGNMDWWIAEAMELAQQRAPLLDDSHAEDLADDLQRAWPDDTPAEAVATFSVMPPGWKAHPAAVTPSRRRTDAAAA